MKNDMTMEEKYYALEVNGLASEQEMHDCILNFIRTETALAEKRKVERVRLSIDGMIQAYEQSLFHAVNTDTAQIKAAIRNLKRLKESLLSLRTEDNGKNV